jgi:hypothetical protein
MNKYLKVFLGIFLTCLWLGALSLNVMAEEGPLVSEDRIADTAEQRMEISEIAFEETEVLLLELYGEAVEVNVEELQIVVKALINEESQEYEEVTLYVNDDTEILKNDQDAQLADIVVGDDVALLYIEENNKKIVNTLWVESE